MRKQSVRTLTLLFTHVLNPQTKRIIPMPFIFVYDIFFLWHFPYPALKSIMN